MYEHVLVKKIMVGPVTTIIMTRFHDVTVYCAEHCDLKKGLECCIVDPELL